MRTYPTVLVVFLALVTVVGFIPMGGAIAPEPVTVQQESPIDEVWQTCALIFAETWCGLLEDAVEDASDEIQGTCPTVLAQAWCDLVEGAMEPPSCASHPPIRVTENAGEEGFVLVEGTPTYRPGSGVIAGLGTQANPYVIAGWCIDGNDDSWDALGVAPNQPEGILIENTDAHVVIQGVNVTGHPGSGVSLSNVQNVALESSTITRNEDHGVGVASSTFSQLINNTISDNGLRGVVLSSASHSVEIKNNTLTGNPQYGVYMQSSFDNSVEGNTISDASSGVFLSSSNENRLEANTIMDNPGRGVYLSSADNNRMHENTITGNQDGIRLYAGGSNLFEGNTIAQNDQDGAWVYSSDFNRFERNTITDNDGYGLFLTSSSETSVNQNTIETNGLAGLFIYRQSHNTQVLGNVIAENDGDGILTNGAWLGTPSGTVAHGNNIQNNDGAGLFASGHSGDVDMVHNWWGHWTGPSGGVTDACTGATANGLGQSIQIGSASVCFDPWLTSANANAGAA